LLTCNADFEPVSDHHVSLSQARRELRVDFRRRFASCANEHIKSLPDEAKAEIEDMVEKCLQPFTFTKSPNHTPRVRGLVSTEAQQYKTESQALPQEEQAREFPIDNWASYVRGGSDQGLGLSLQSSEFLSAPPGARSSMSSDQPICDCKGQCECPQPPNSFFYEQFMESGASDINQSSDSVEWDCGNSSMDMY
jgi:hypothetical protein